MQPYRLDVHGVYGSICKDGEFVQRGDILGLNAEGDGVVVAPVSGWIRLLRNAIRQEQSLPPIAVEIWPEALLSEAKAAHAAAASNQKLV